MQQTLRSVGRRALLLGGLTAGLIGLQACASVKVAMPGLQPEPTTAASEKSVLVEETARLAALVPPAAQRGGLTLVVLGGRGDAEMAAAQAYLSGLPADDRLSAVLGDVDAVLRRARAVAEVGRPGPIASDREVALLESAISDVQHARRVYVAALRLLREEGVPLTRAEIREVNDALVQSCRDIGAAADMVSLRLTAPPRVRVAETEAEGATDAGY